MFLRLFGLFLILSLLQACSDSSDNIDSGDSTPAPTVYSAEIVWTEYGIPHVTAQDWGGLGYGYGYAYAQDNYCVAMKEMVRANGESARYLGDEGNLNDDFLYKLYNSDEAIQRIWFDAQSQRVLDVVDGYVAGLNRFLNETGVDNLAEGEEGCRGAEWVREVDAADFARLFHKLILRASGGALADLIVAAEPSPTVTAITPATLEMLASLDPAEMVKNMGLPEPSQIGSNAYAIGAEAGTGAAGILFGNPHFPWQGPERWVMSHLTIPGEYDASGAALHGIPGILIGFNQNLAWTHTVSTGRRFTFYELTLNPDNPLEYIYDGEVRSIEPITVSADTVAEDGSIIPVEHTFYNSHYGLVLDLGGVDTRLGGWPNLLGTVMAYRDANLENVRAFEMWLNMAQSQDLEEFAASMGVIGNPWVNTIAADRFGDALYTDNSVVPHVTRQKLDSCVRGPIAEGLTALRFYTLDGSDSACEWGNDEGAPEGLFGLDNLPALNTREYGANANDSYWLANPRQLLEGFSPLIGIEGIEQSLRTRLTFLQAEERLAGTDEFGDPGFTAEKVKQISYDARNYAADLVLVDVLAQCSAVSDWSVYSANPAAMLEACSVLDGWDGKHQVDSVGAHIFFEFWRIARDIVDLWAVAFDAADPVNTPNTLNVADATVLEAVRQALADGVAVLLDAGIALDLPWGEVQFDEKNGVRIPIHGGSGAMLFSVITSDLVPGEGYSDIRHGNSYIQTVTWDETDCPNADAILTYSQSTDPASDHYSDATELYSRGGWIDMAFCEADIEAAEIRRESITSEGS